MTIDEAIKLIERADIPKTKELYPDFYAALKLGIEALKRLKEYRQWHRSTADGPLPGETKD